MTTQIDTSKSTKNGNKNKNGEATVAVENKPETSKLETKSLWADFRTAFEAEKAAKAAIDSAVSNRSKAVEAIKNAMGTGPFQVAGLGLVTIRHRPGKDDNGNLTGESTYFFVSMGAKSITVVE